MRASGFSLFFFWITCGRAAAAGSGHRSEGPGEPAASSAVPSTAQLRALLCCVWTPNPALLLPAGDAPPGWRPPRSGWRPWSRCAASCGQPAPPGPAGRRAGSGAGGASTVGRQRAHCSRPHHGSNKERDVVLPAGPLVAAWLCACLPSRCGTLLPKILCSVITAAHHKFCCPAAAGKPAHSQVQPGPTCCIASAADAATVACRLAGVSPCCTPPRLPCRPPHMLQLQLLHALHCRMPQLH